METANKSHELFPPLRYPAGWQEILTAPDAVDYQFWLDGLTALTGQRCQAMAETPFWAQTPEAIRHRWQQAIELVAASTIDPADLESLDEAAIIETALLTLQANIESEGWYEEGLVFTVPSVTELIAPVIDLRNLPELPTPLG